MSDSNQQPHHLSVDETVTVDTQRFASDNRSLLAKYMDQCDRMASLLASLREDVRNDSQESLNTMKKPSSHGDMSRFATHETPFDGGTTAHDEARTTNDDSSAVIKSRISSINGGDSIEEGSETQGLERGARSK
ncbi:hypothetical protein D0861_01124 [Hortaea werneckii]|uniref:Uncharacterized protein n=1 Tax=Hortaea werneckii TaxID=91943 RepID=A0A3M7G1E0_HORWE|nr:hypothetical protein D0861_01124 [Hortaea werneckii]